MTVTDADRNDSIDFIISEWRRRRPDLDAGHLAIVGRVARLSVHMSNAVGKHLAEHGLAWDQFDLLITIYRWENEPNGIRPTDLYAECLLSSGSIAKRLQHAERDGYLVRRSDPDDGRATRVTLTKKGRAIVEKAIPGHGALSNALLSSLNNKERETLARLLRRLLVSLEQGKP